MSLDQYVRLDKFLSRATELSRSQSRRLIKNGRVALSGDVVRNPEVRVAADASVCLDGVAIDRHRARYFMVHKPSGVVCANRDGLHHTVSSLLREPRVDALHAAGRLDLDATGLVLLTDDGQWSHRVTAPRRKAAKRYCVDLAEPLEEATASQLRNGLLLRGENKPTRPAKLVLLNPMRCRLTLYEGRYHQVKRMFAAVGNRVVALHRESIGSIVLDAALAPGQYRALTEQEVGEF